MNRWPLSDESSYQKDSYHTLFHTYLARPSSMSSSMPGRASAALSTMTL